MREEREIPKLTWLLEWHKGRGWGRENGQSWISETCRYFFVFFPPLSLSAIPLINLEIPLQTRFSFHCNRICTKLSRGRWSFLLSFADPFNCEKFLSYSFFLWMKLVQYTVLRASYIFHQKCFWYSSANFDFWHFFCKWRWETFAYNPLYSAISFSFARTTLTYFCFPWLSLQDSFSKFF